MAITRRSCDGTGRCAGGSAKPPARAWEPFRGPLQRWPQTTDLLLAFLAFALTLAMWAQTKVADAPLLDSFADVGTFLCVFGGSLALLWRRSHPLPVHAIVLAASVLVHVGSMRDGLVALTFSLYSLGRYEADGRASVAGVLAALLFVAGDALVLSEPTIGGILAAGMVIAVWYVGRRLRFRGEYLRLLEERAAYLERAQKVEAERAVAAERTRIAREMHDVVAHQLSLMTVQAGAARTVSGTDPEAAREAMVAVEKAGRQAVAEMRQLLDVLRPAGPARPLDPQPGIQDLGALVREVEEVGPRVRLEIEETIESARPRLPARLGLNAYRIVQEALTNVIRHAGPGVTVAVKLRRLDDRLVVEVSDNGGGAGQVPGPAVDQELDLATGPTTVHRGHGIVGMRERVELLGGTFYAGTRREGGFEVRAELPLVGASDPRRDRQAGRASAPGRR